MNKTSDTCDKYSSHWEFMICPNNLLSHLGKACCYKRDNTDYRLHHACTLTDWSSRIIMENRAPKRRHAQGSGRVLYTPSISI